MAWVRASNFHSYSELDDRVHVTLIDDPAIPENSTRYWGVIHFFEQYPEHEVTTITLDDN